MAVDGIYMKDNSITTTTAIGGKDASQMDMNDFMNLLVAQMTNQDMLNPSTDTEFIAQMAQFSSLQGIQTIQEYQLSSYASSYAGKYVTIANQTASGGIETITGKVDAVTFYDGQPKVMVDGKAYDLHTVMEVSDSASGGTLSDASKYIGQKVTVSYKNEFGAVKEYTGVVTGVTIKDNAPHLIIEGADGEKKEFPLSSLKGVDESDKTDDSDKDNDNGNVESEPATQDYAAYSARLGAPISADTTPPEKRDTDIDRSGSEDWVDGVTKTQLVQQQVPLSSIPQEVQYVNGEGSSRSDWIHQGYRPDRIVDTRREINDMGDDDDNDSRNPIESVYTPGQVINTMREINDMDADKEDRKPIKSSYRFGQTIDIRREINDM